VSESDATPAAETGGNWFSTSSPEVQALFVPTTPPAGDAPAADTDASLLTVPPVNVAAPTLDTVAAELLADPPVEGPVVTAIAIEPAPDTPAAPPARPATMKSDDWAAMFEDGGDDHDLDLDTLPSEGSTGGAAAPAAERDVEPPSVEPVVDAALTEPGVGAASDEPAVEPAIVVESLVDPVEVPSPAPPPPVLIPEAAPIAAPPPPPAAPPAPPRVDPPRAAAPEAPPVAPRRATSEPPLATDTDQVAAALEAAAQNPALQFQASAELGRLYVRRGRLHDGIEWLERAARAQAPVRDHGLAVQYELGDALERSGEPARALDVFADLDLDAASYRDVQERMARLRQALGERPGR
jgi:hypothetical protein